MSTENRQKKTDCPSAGTSKQRLMEGRSGVANREYIADIKPGKQCFKFFKNA